MIHPLPIARISQIRPLFQQLSQSQPMCNAVLEGIYPGKVYVDDLAQPRTALLTTYIESEAHGTWCFLAGEPGNHAFSQVLNAAIFSRQVIAQNSPILFFTCDPDDWGDQIQFVFAPCPPIWFHRLHFISRRVGFNWQAALPPGFKVERITNHLCQFPGLQLPDDIAATLSKWKAITDPGFMDFGFVTLDLTNPQLPVIISWATVDFIAAGAGDLGFFTQPDYRRRSLGTIAVAAALEYGFAHGLGQIHWTCDADNPGSVRTAAKLGLEYLEDYNQAVLVMDEQRHMSFFQQD